MKQTRSLFASLLAALLLSLTSGVSSATTCIALPPLKPVRRICGIVLVPSDDHIANAKVTVLQGGKEIAVQETGDDGKFSFAQLRAGDYEIQVQVNGLGVASTQIALVHPKAKPRREIAVNMSLSRVCSSFSLVNQMNSRPD